MDVSGASGQLGALSCASPKALLCGWWPHVSVLVCSFWTCTLCGGLMVGWCSDDSFWHAPTSVCQHWLALRNVHLCYGQAWWMCTYEGGPAGLKCVCAMPLNHAVQHRHSLMLPKAETICLDSSLCMQGAGCPCWHSGGWAFLQCARCHRVQPPGTVFESSCTTQCWQQLNHACLNAARHPPRCAGWLICTHGCVFCMAQ